MIIQDGMSCHKASKMLQIDYNNAKMIFRVFRSQGRIKQIPKELKRVAKDL